MLSILNLSEGIQPILFVVGVILLFKKIAEIDGWHGLRVVALTVVLSGVVVYFFDVLFTFVNPRSYGCVIE